MEKRKAITLTEAAAQHARHLMVQAGGNISAIRLGLKNAGCAGQSYTLNYAEKPEPFDEVVEDKGIKILIEAKALMFLLGTRMDYRRDTLSAGFVFENPNETDACGCGESVTLKSVSERSDS